MSLYEIRIQMESYEEAQHLLKALEAADAPGETITFHDVTPCDVIVNHGPGYMSITKCEVKGEHREHTEP
jgi:hypothetical protein